MKGYTYTNSGQLQFSLDCPFLESGMTCGHGKWHSLHVVESRPNQPE